MEVTSGSVTHLYSIPHLQTVGQVDSHLDVVERVTIYINSSTTFDYRYTTTDIDGKTQTITESRTTEAFSTYGVDLSTDTISDFRNYDDLAEELVLNWAFAAQPDVKTNHQNKNEAEVLEKKDILLNPLKYKHDSPVTPWRKKADEASAPE
jgi:hypothetical protein